MKELITSVLKVKVATYFIPYRVQVTLNFFPPILDWFKLIKTKYVKKNAFKKDTLH